ncbi:hypothetical protein [Actinoplanes subglobosus]|uniref:Uncharacterized protein n=1 Tax=Actinoplanes subglobosus TaxID=1547892 RepID=A0ABV8J4Q8_9ACTN
MQHTAGPPRLTPGCHLYEGPDGVWRYYLPGDRFVRITAPADLIGPAQRLLHGRPGTELPAGATELLTALDGQGILAAEEPAPRRGRIQVHGDGPIAEQVTRLLSAAHDIVDPAAGLTADVDVVVCCAGWLPDSAWRTLDATCAGLGVAWHGCYAEGTRWFAGPMAVPGLTAGYRDTRARRLGACGVPQELLGYWSYLDRGEDLPPVPRPGPGVAAIVAGVLVADVEAFLRDGRPAASGRQLEIDPADLSVTAHPVLPLPFPAGAA